MSVKIHTKIHPSAIIDPKAELDSSVEVGAYSVIGASVKVGENTKIGSHVGPFSTTWLPILVFLSTFTSAPMTEYAPTSTLESSSAFGSIMALG